MNINRFKRIMGLVIIALCFAIPGIKISAKEEEPQLYTLESAGANEYAYNTLNETQKKIFMAMGQECEKYLASFGYGVDVTDESKTISVTYKLANGESVTMEEILTAIHRFIYANPKYYWLAKRTGYSLEGKTVVVDLEIDPYYYSYSERKKTDDAINEILPLWVDEVADIAQKKDAYYAALKARDLILDKASYAWDSYGNAVEELWAHSIAGIFTGDGAVCEGYAKTYEYLLNLTGIPNIYIIGQAKGDSHAWNAVGYNGKWYLCDITWDDSDGSDTHRYAYMEYTYFFMPESLFRRSHTPYDGKSEKFYELPKFEDDPKQAFYVKFGCYTDKEITEENAEEFANSIITGRYTGTDSIFAVFPNGQERNFVKYVEPYITGQPSSTTFMYQLTEFGSLMVYDVPIIGAPSSSITLDKTGVELENKGQAVITATLDENSDDRVIWRLTNAITGDKYDASRYLKVSGKGTKAEITGLRDGKVLLTAIVYSSVLPGSEKPISAECEIVIGKGEPCADAVIWQNGSKDKKSCALDFTIKATNWKDAKGKVKKGKLIWFVSDEITKPVFDSNKHTVSFEVTKSKNATVNGKGVVSAKKAGKVYVYACDTGSMLYEDFEVDILAAPGKMFLTDTPGQTDKDCLIKKEAIEANSSLKVYITPFVKDGIASSDCTYTVKIPKTEQAKYVSIGKIESDEAGNKFFTITGIDFDRSKNKPAQVKIDVICDQSNKKASMTALVTNPVFSAKLTSEVAADSLVLVKKQDSLTFKLELETYIDGVSVTTDKIKIYVGQTAILLDENDKVTVDKGASVKAKFDAKNMTLTLTAGKDAGSTAFVSALFTNPANKENVLMDLAKIDKDGKVTI